MGVPNTYPVLPPQLVKELKVAPDAGNATNETPRTTIVLCIAFIPFLEMF
jgi:hypothetical protein